MSRQPDPSAHAWNDVAMPCAVVDIQTELHFWEKTYARQAFHRPGLAFRHYVPTLKFAYDIYLLSRRRPLQELLPALPTRYEAALSRGTRLDWSLASMVIARVWERLNAPLEQDPPLFAPLVATGMDERTVIAEAMQRRAGNGFTR
ncbi:hypothetical protein LJR143_001998 [Pseudoxanthomonas sp. LjRoot143]|uniref:hypothetical protein n=1 Tax=Pseudoxanthomonas sp. LjRoot143 TaxID=3342266 RepID=UPI003ECD0F29